MVPLNRGTVLPNLPILLADIGYVIGASILLIALSIVSYRFVENPFRNKQNISSRMVWSTATIAVFVLVTASVTIKFNDGYKSRFATSTFGLLHDIENSEDYIKANFDSFRLREFSQESPSHRKVILIGDSFAMDLVNALDEAGSLSTNELSVHHISSGCGNLYLDYSLANEVATKFRSHCEREGWFTDEVIALMDTTDEIWFASWWTDWDVGYLAESLNNLDRDFSATVRLFGTKFFWEDPKSFLQILEIYEDGNVVPIPETSVQTNIELARIAATNDVMFVDLLSLLCEEPQNCDLRSSPTDSLITVDGIHLTPGGAKRLADRLPSSITRP